ncbi:ferredoxin reductase family protein [Aquimarina sp. D1M17]|uniref:ferredoxin reductase family protein n=1 Tax=Aquimarina acroporae TaxID=2937283 RepID=UPI0020C00733|nr:ferredoxin reductase family protein [Aquimarina acroporae]MCK8521806.1 ferredoxin reductase family protein [Aquimarina acroporae]
MRIIKQEHYFPIIVFIHFIFWGIDITLYQGDYVFGVQNIIGEVFSSWVMTVFAINFLMATKARWVERIFGGLDKMYMIHRRAGTLAVILLILHFITVPKSEEFTIGKPLGFFSLLLILIGVVLSVAPVFKRKLKYNRWIKIHKLMGIFYIMGIAHFLNVPTLTSELPIVKNYVLLMSIIGVSAWFYKSFLFGLFNKKLKYSLSSVKNFANDVVELTFSPKEKSLDFEAGQFAFLSIPGFGNGESHPFTISNDSSENDLRFTIKSLGDYTANIQSALAIGTEAKIQGPYGLFDFKKATHKEQIWLAGGIGITPFLSFLRVVPRDYKITLIWSVGSVKEANYKDEIESLTAEKDNVDFVVWNSDDKGHFSIGKKYNVMDVVNKSFYVCGPETMRESYIKQLREKGVLMKEIHYEEFSFR